MISPSVIHNLSHRCQLVRARAAGKLALATTNADRWLSELGL